MLFLSGRTVLTLKRSTLSVVLGLTAFAIDGFLVNTIFELAGLPPVNAMYLLEPPFADLPWFNTAFIGLCAVALAALASIPYEIVIRKRNRARLTADESTLTSEN